MTQQRIDDLQKAIKTGLPIEINPKAVLEIISMLAAEKKRADAAIADMPNYRKCSTCAPTGRRYTRCADDCSDCEFDCLCHICSDGSQWEWRGPCAENAPTGAEGEKSE